MPRERGRLSFVALAPVLLAVRAVSGCVDRPSFEELVAEPVIVTKRDPSVDFGAFATFAMTDTIPLFTSVDTSVDAGATVDPALANPTLDEISAQLSSRGYRRVTRGEGPDLGVAVTALNRLKSATLPYGAWWGAGATSPGYWGYAGSPTVAQLSYTTVAWQSGTLLIELFDLRAARDQARSSGQTPSAAAPSTTAPVTAVWAAVLHGLVGPPGASLAAPPIAPIRQAFIQSPYVVRPRAPQSEVQP